MKKQFSKYSHKKASLEISVQAIVIVVLAMTLLGLGLGFVRNLFSDISDTTQSTTQQVQQQISQQLITSDKKLNFPKNEIKAGRGDAEVLSMGIRNKEDSTLSYMLDFKFISVPSDLDEANINMKESEAADLPECADEESNDETCVTNAEKALTYDQWFQFDESVQELASAEITVKDVRLSIPKSAKVGSYALNFRVLKEDEAPTETEDGVYSTYDQKDFFIVVTD